MVENFKFILGIITIIILLASRRRYISDIFRGITKPHLYTWLIWGVFTIIIYIIQVQGQAGVGAWMTGISGILCLYIAFLSLKRGTKNFRKQDNIFLGAAICGLLFWIFTDDRTLSLILICTIDLCGFVPTFRKSWLNPYEETLSLYATDVLRYALSFFSLESYNIDTVFYLILWIIVDSILVIYILWRRRVIGKPHIDIPSVG